MVKVLSSLEVIKHYSHRLRLREIVDSFCPMRDLEDTVTHGQVIEALVGNRLTAPLPLYEIEDWARSFAVEEVYHLFAEQLNDDRLGRALDALCPQVESVRGAVALQAMREFGLDASKFHWDLSSIVFEGDYDTQKEGFPLIEYGYSSNKGDDRKQLRMGLAAAQDGAVPLWHDVLSGHTADVTTVVATMKNLQEQLQVSSFLLIGDSKLLSYENMFAIDRAGNFFLGPLSARAELDREFLSLPSDKWRWLNYTSERDRKKPLQEQIQYMGQETEWKLTNPATGEPVTFRKIFLISSEEREACRKNRARQMQRAQEDIDKIRPAIAHRRYYTTKDKIVAKVEKILTSRKVRDLFTFRVFEVKGQLRVRVDKNKKAIRAAEALDGYYVL
jgi:transposase